MVVPRSPGPAPDVEIPHKLYFKIGEVADLVGVQTHVLRYWEKEIPAIRPTKSVSNQRRYRRRDVEIFREIRQLLYQERYTLAGARKRLAPRRGARGAAEADEAHVPPAVDTVRPSLSPEIAALKSEHLGRVRSGLRELIRMAGEEP